MNQNYHSLTLVRIAIKEHERNKCWQGCRARNEYGRTINQYSNGKLQCTHIPELKTKLLYNLAIPLSIYPKEMELVSQEGI